MDITEGGMLVLAWFVHSRAPFLTWRGRNRGRREIRKWTAKPVIISKELLPCKGRAPPQGRADWRCLRICEKRREFRSAARKALTPMGGRGEFLDLKAGARPLPVISF